MPGAEEVLALLELRLHAASGAWDVVVVDCAPTAETLRLLALPEALGWYMRPVLPVERRVVKALRPVLTRAAGVPMPGDAVFDAVERLHAELDEVRALLTGPRSTVRLVLTPEAVVLAEARRSYTTLSLFGYRVDGVVANRVFPAAGADDWRAGWVVAQDRVLDEVAQSFAGLPLWRSEYRAGEPVGVPALVALAAEAYDGADPLAVPDGDEPFRLTRDARGTVLHLALPGVSRTDVDLARHGDDLVVTVGSYRRLLTVPAGLSRHRSAALASRTASCRCGSWSSRARGPEDERASRRPGRLRGRGGRQAARRRLRLGRGARATGWATWPRPSGGRRRTTWTSTWRPAPRTAGTARSAGPSRSTARPRRRSASTSRPRSPRWPRPPRRTSPPPCPSGREPGVEHIDVTDDDWPEERRVSLTCGIDVGGTKILGGVVDEDGTVVEEQRVGLARDRRRRDRGRDHPRRRSSWLPGTRWRPSASARPATSTSPGRW